MVNGLILALSLTQWPGRRSHRGRDPAPQGAGGGRDAQIWGQNEKKGLDREDGYHGYHGFRSSQIQIFNFKWSFIPWPKEIQLISGIGIKTAWWTANYQATGSSGSSFHPAWNDWWAGNQACAHDLGILSMTCSPKNEKDNHNWKRVLTPHFHEVSRELCHKLGCFGNYIPSIATLQIDAAEKRAAKAEQEYKAMETMETMETTKTAQWFHHVLPCFTMFSTLKRLCRYGFK